MLKWISVLLVTGLALGLWWSQSNSAKDDGAAGTTPEESEGAGTSDPGVLTAETQEGTANLQREGVGASEPELSTSGLPPKQIHVQVMLELGGSPVPGAQVFFLDRTQDSGWRAIWQDAARRADYLTTHAKRLEADRLGRLAVPATEDGALLGVSPGLQGEIEWLGFPAGVVELKLAIHADVEVEVVDAQGFHVPHVPVALCIDRPGAPTYLVIRKTAAAAPARFTNVKRLLRSDGPLEGYAVTLAFPVSERERVKLPQGKLPDEPIILTMPDCGSVRVNVTGADGAAMLTSTLVSLAIQSDVEGSAYRAEVSERLADGSAHFPFIGVGTQLALRVHSIGELRPIETSHAGPSLAGEEIVISAQMAMSFPTLVGRLVNANGDPLGDRRGRMRLTSGGAARSQTILQSDAVGRFRAVFRDPWKAGEELSANLELTALPGEPPLDVVLDVTHATPDGETELGDVVLEVQPALASGQVTGTDGSPLIAANIRVEVPREDSEEWYSPRGFVAPSVADGSFTIYGRTDATRMRLVVRRAGFQTVTHGPIPAGVEDLVVELTAGQDAAPREGLRPSGG